MKTSLNLDNYIFKAAQKEAQKTGKTLSETISLWARTGFEHIRQQKTRSHKTPQAVDLGGPASIDLSSRRDWRDLL